MNLENTAIQIIRRNPDVSCFNMKEWQLKEVGTLSYPGSARTRNGKTQNEINFKDKIITILISCKGITK